MTFKTLRDFERVVICEQAKHSKMSYWFHRNSLKATALQSFDIKMFAHDPEALKICGDLKMSRARLLELLPDPNHTIDQVTYRRQ